MVGKKQTAGVRLRIGIDVHWLSWKKIRSSGVATYLFEQLVYLDKMASDFCLFLLYFRSCDGQHIFPEGLSRCIARPLPGRDIVWRHLVLPAAALYDRVDVLFIPWHSVPVLWPGRLVVTIHDMSYARCPADCIKANVRRHQSLVIPFAVRRASHIITVSDATRNDLIFLLGVHPERITVIPNASNSIYNPLPNNSDWQTMREFNIESPFFLFVGGVELHKNLKGALEGLAIAIKKFGANCLLAVAGGQPQAIQEVANSYGSDLVGYIRPLGRLSPEKLASLYRLAQALLLPSYWEGQSIAALEAISCGCPVIASDIPPNREAIGDGGLFVDPSNPTDIASAMFHLLDPAVRATLSERAIAHSKNYSWERSASKLLEVLTNVGGKAGNRWRGVHNEQMC